MIALKIVETILLSFYSIGTIAMSYKAKNNVMAYWLFAIMLALAIFLMWF